MHPAPQSHDQARRSSLGSSGSPVFASGECRVLRSLCSSSPASRPSIERRYPLPTRRPWTRSGTFYVLLQIDPAYDRYADSASPKTQDPKSRHPRRRPRSAVVRCLPRRPLNTTSPGDRQALLLRPHRPPSLRATLRATRHIVPAAACRYRRCWAPIPTARLGIRVRRRYSLDHRRHRPSWAVPLHLPPWGQCPRQRPRPGQHLWTIPCSGDPRHQTSRFRPASPLVLTGRAPEARHSSRCPSPPSSEACRARRRCRSTGRSRPLLHRHRPRSPLRRPRTMSPGG